MNGDLKRTLERADHSHAAFVADEQSVLEDAYREHAERWLLEEYAQPIALEVADRWRSPVRGDKRDYRAREYHDDQGRPRLHLVIHDHKTSENTRFDDYAFFEEAYRDWLERKRALTAEERSAWEARRAEREQASSQAAQARAARAKQVQAEAEADERRRDDNIAADHAVWSELPVRGRSAYLVRKGLPHVTPFRYEGQKLAEPLWSATGEFQGLQRIDGRGNKLFTDGAHKKGAFGVLGGSTELEGRIDLHNLPRFIAEGTATAVRPHQVYDEPVILAYDAHNIAPVIQAICAALDDAGMQKQKHAWLRRLVILADNDRWKTEQLHNGVALGNVGLEAAHAAAYEANGFSVRVACPDFTGLSTRSNPTDFDDLARLAGLDAVRAQIEGATLADPNLVYAKRKRLYLRDHAAQGGTFSPTVDLSNLRDGLTVVQSPQNTQKTRSLISVAAQCHAEGKLFIYVTHRVSLAADAARKLGLELYSDYNRDDLSLMRGLAITLNSLHHLEDAEGNLTTPYILVLDESDQSIPALTGSHMTNKHANLRVLSRLVARAQRVVCLDADAGEMTRWALKTWRGGERVNWIRNHWDVGAGKVAYVYPHRAQPYQKLGSGTLGVTDGLGESRRLAFTLEAQGVKTQLINGETSHDLENIAFVADIDGHAPTVEAIVASPSISTGVSLIDPSYTRAVGVFYRANGPDSEALQALWRARQAKEWHLWAQPSGHQGDAIDLEARYGAALDAELERSGNPTHLSKWDDYGYSDLKRLVAERNRQARGTFDEDLIWLMVRQGIDVRLMPRPTDDEAQVLRDVLKAARERERTAYAEERGTAERYDRTTAAKLREHGTLTSRERFGLERFDHTEFFHNADAKNLRTWLLADYRGRYRVKMERLERVLTDDETAHTYVSQMLERVEMRADTPLTLLRREFLQRVLTAVDFVSDVTALNDTLTPEELETAAQCELETRAAGRSGDCKPPPTAQRLRTVALEHFGRYTRESERVRELLAWIEANREVLAGVVALPTPDKLAANAVRYIASWLELLGLRQHRAGKNARGEYVLDGASLALAAHVFDRRGGDTFSKESIFRKSVPLENAVPEAPIPPPNSDPALVITELLDKGALDDFGPQKLAVIRQKLREDNTAWLNQLVHSRMWGALGYVV